MRFGRGGTRAQQHKQTGAADKDLKHHCGRGIRAAITAETSMVLMTPPKNTGSDENRLPVSLRAMSGGTSRPASRSQRVKRQRGGL
jgi:hypothetical protein